MGYFDNEKNCDEYVKMAEGYDGFGLIEKLGNYIAPGQTVLELGMGPGVDLDLLCERYVATGSDSSKVFVDRYSRAHPEARVLMLDAVSIDTDERYDAVYSNKVLQHLTRDELRRSLVRQAEVVERGGYLMHSFWFGDKEERHHGLLFTYHTSRSIEALTPSELEIVEAYRYDEMKKDDSLAVVFRRSE